MSRNRKASLEQELKAIASEWYHFKTKRKFPKTKDYTVISTHVPTGYTVQCGRFKRYMDNKNFAIKNKVNK